MLFRIITEQPRKCQSPKQLYSLQFLPPRARFFVCCLFVCCWLKRKGCTASGCLEYEHCISSFSVVGSFIQLTEVGGYSIPQLHCWQWFTVPGLATIPVCWAQVIRLCHRGHLCGKGLVTSPLKEEEKQRSRQKGKLTSDILTGKAEYCMGALTVEHSSVVLNQDTGFNSCYIKLTLVYVGFPIGIQGHNHRYRISFFSRGISWRKPTFSH